MGLRNAWWRYGFARPHVLLVTAPGGTAVRLAVERFLAGNGWPLAGSPADADVLVFATGAQVHPELADAVEAAWAAMPAPRSRLQPTDPSTVDEQLLATRAELLDPARQKPATQQHREMHHDMPDMSGHDMGDGMHHDMGQHDMHGGHDMGGMEMPAGLPLAGSAEDRDGLGLDVLRISLGPVLPHWPAGLRIDATVQGDVIQNATAHVLSNGADSYWTGREPARTLDSLYRLFAVAGADRFALTAKRLRDDALAGRSIDDGLTRLHRRASRSWLLRSLTGRIPVDPDGSLLGLPPPGDVTTRWLSWLEMSEAPEGAVLQAIPRLLAGRELAEARLIVAALDPDLDAVVAAHG